jgi:hypothetical protein
LSGIINSNEQLVAKINYVLKNKCNSVVDIVNDKLTLSVFSELKDNMRKVKEINLIIRDSSYIPSGKEISREFEISRSVNDLLFNSYDIIEKINLAI